MSAAKFLDKLESTGLLDDNVLATLRKQVASSKKRVSPQAVAKLLIEKGHLTSKQAKKLLEGVASAPKKQAKSQPKQEELTPLEDDLQPLDDLTPLDDLQPLDDLEPLDETPGLAADDDLQPLDDLTPLDDDAGLSPLEDDGGLTPLDASDDLTPLDDSSGLTPVDDGLTPLDDGLTPIDDSGGLTPLDDDGGLTPLDEPAPAATATAPEGQPAKSGGKSKVAETVSLLTEKPVRTTVWDSKLLLIGGGGLVFLLLAGFLLWWALTKQPADELFAAAEDAYKEQSYGAAIDQYEYFLEQYPNSDQASQAKVRIVTAKLRQGHSAKNWDKTYDDAAKLLPEVENEEAFGKFARPELATILPDIAKGFAEAGRSSKDLSAASDLADKATAAMVFVDNPNYIPTSFKVTQLNKIELIKEDIGIVKRRISEADELKTAITKIEEHVAGGETVAAFQVRRALLGDYPGLEKNPELIAAVLTISNKERELVRNEEGSIRPLTTEDAPPTDFSVIIASRRGDDATGVSDGSLFVLAKGSVYGLDAISGEVLWRRFVGFGTDIHPVSLGVGANVDALLVDTNRNELVRIEGRSGKLVWRLPIPAEAAPLTAPRILNDMIYVGDRSGALREVNPDDGVVKRVVRIPKPLVTGPVLDDENELIYQLGEHSNLYVLSANSLECIEVYYLGHKEGAITLPPTLVRGVAFIAENVGSDYSIMHVLQPDSKSKAMGKLVDPIRLDSRVRTPMLSVAAGNVGRLVVLGERGAVTVYEVDIRNEKTPVTKVANLADTLREPQVGYHLIDGGEYWLGDRRLTKYDIQTTRSQLARRWVTDNDMITLAPLEKRGKVLYTVRRRQGSSGVSIAAVQAVDGKRLWQTDVGVPLAGPAIVDAANRRIVAVTSHGELFDIDSGVLQRGYIDAPSQTYDLSEFVFSYHHQVDLGDGKFMFFNSREPEKLLMLDLAGGQRRLNTKTLAAAPGAITTPPVAWNGGLLLGLAEGKVEWSDLSTSGKQILPFQPPLETGTRLQWKPPALLGDGSEFAIAHSGKKLYRIALKPQPKPHLASAAEANLDAVPTSALAATADTLYGVSRKDGIDKVYSFSLPNLTANEDRELTGLLTWGPDRLGDHVVLTTDRDQLIGFATGNQPAWQKDLTDGSLAGAPIGSQDMFLMASRSGVVTLHDRAADEDKLRIDIAQPLSTSPVIFNNRLLLSGSDGVVHVTAEVVPANFPGNE